MNINPCTLPVEPGPIPVERRRIPLERRLGIIRLLVIASLYSAPAALADRSPVVILLSWDGVRHDYPELGGVPGLERIQRDGARAERLIPGWPSSTFPGHVTLATGVWADRHGIVDNQFFDRERGAFSMDSDASWIAAEPLWIAAERQGVKAATFFWVGSEFDWQGQRSTYRVAPFDSSIGEDIKVDQILAWIDLPAAERPGLIMSYWHGTDHVGHEKGPDHPAVADALRAQDVQLQRLLKGLDERDLWSTTTLIIVSDHGMTGIEDFYDVPTTLATRGIRGHVAGGGSVNHVFLEDPSQADMLVAVLKTDGLRAYRGDALPADMHLRHPGRTGDVVAVADPPLMLGAPVWYLRYTFKALHTCCGLNRGAHGYDPAHPDMGALLVAVGRGVPAGAQLGPVPQVDIAPTVARLLGIEPPRDSVGRAVPRISAAPVTQETPVSPGGSDD